MSDATYTIGALARAAGVPASTLRYYERAGLLVPRKRSAGNYRVYDADDLARLRFIRAAQTAGFTLHDVGILMNLEDGTAQVCDEVQHLLARRLVDVGQELDDLRRVQASLRASLKLCRSDATGQHCRVIERLGNPTPQEKSTKNRKTRKKT